MALANVVNAPQWQLPRLAHTLGARAAACIGTAPNMPWPGASCSTARIDLEINTARRSWCDKKVRGLAGIKFQVLDS